MYNVSEEYSKAIAKPDCIWKATVCVQYANNEQTVFEDDALMGGIRIESQMVSGSSNDDKIDIGAVPAKTITLTIIDQNSNLHRYAGARISIYVYLELENGKFEEIPMGVFWVDATKLSRFENQITIVGYDGMLSFKYVLTDSHRAELKGKSATEAAQLLAAYSACGFNQDLSAMPNGNIPFDFDSQQIETAWDGIMWVAQIMGCFARINRFNNLEFVPIMTRWKYYNEEHTLGTIISVRDIDGDQRYDDLRFADDRIHIIGVAMEGDSGKLVTREVGGLADDANITITLEKNPIIAGSEKSLETILDDILAQVSTSYFYAFQTAIKNDPSLDAGDVIRLTGGRINGTNKNNDLIGFITHSVWNYHGRQTITNVGQVPIVSSGASGEDTAPDISELAIGDNVTFTGSYHYAAAISDEGSRATPGAARISNLCPGAPHPVHLIHTGSDSNVYGWVNLQDVQKTSANPAARNAAPAKARAASSAILGAAAGFHVAPVPQSQKVGKGGGAKDRLISSDGYQLAFDHDGDGTNSRVSLNTPDGASLWDVDLYDMYLEIQRLKNRVYALEQNKGTSDRIVASDGSEYKISPKGFTTTTTTDYKGGKITFGEGGQAISDASCALEINGKYEYIKSATEFYVHTAVFKGYSSHNDRNCGLYYEATRNYVNENNVGIYPTGVGMHVDDRGNYVVGDLVFLSEAGIKLVLEIREDGMLTLRVDDKVNSSTKYYKIQMGAN